MNIFFLIILTSCCGQLAAGAVGSIFRNTLNQSLAVAPTSQTEIKIMKGRSAFIQDYPKNDTPITYRQYGNSPEAALGDHTTFKADYTVDLFTQTDIRCQEIVVQDTRTAVPDFLLGEKAYHIVFNATTDPVWYCWGKKGPGGSDVQAITKLRKIDSSQFQEVFVPSNRAGTSCELGLYLSESDNLPNLDHEDTIKHLESSTCWVPINTTVPRGESFHVHKQDNSLRVHPVPNTLFHLVNTTNEPLYATIIYVENGRALAGVRFRQQKVCPQQRVLMAYVQKDGFDVVLAIYATQEELQKEAPVALTSIKLPNETQKNTFVITKSLDEKTPYKVHLPQQWPKRLIPTLLWSFVSSPPTFSRLKLSQMERSVLATKVSDISIPIDIDFRSNHKELAWEQKFMAGRKRHIEQSLPIFLGAAGAQTSISSSASSSTSSSSSNSTSQVIPSIGLVFTGGGYRAMIQTAGFLAGAKSIGLLDCCCYMAGISGSTWALSTWVASGRPIEDYLQNYLRRRVNHRGKGEVYRKHGLETLQQLFREVAFESDLAERLLVQNRFNQLHGWIGFYGHALAHALLEGQELNGNTSHDIKLSDLKANLQDPSRYPLPIFAALESEQATEHDHRWVELTPGHIGIYGEKNTPKFINTEIFGSRIRNGQIIHRAPELRLAHVMGILGSAFAFSTWDALNRGNGKGVALSVVKSIDAAITTVFNDTFPGDEFPINNERVSVGSAPNFCYKTGAQQENRTPFETKKHLDLVDGGMLRDQGNTHNFGSVPLLARGTQVLIMCDSTPHPNEDRPKHLIASALEAKKLGYPFPEITEQVIEKIKKERATLIVTANGKGPAVVYIQCKRDDVVNPGFDPSEGAAGFTATTNFCYTENQFDKLSGLAQGIMEQPDVKKVIQEAIQWAMVANWHPQ